MMMRISISEFGGELPKADISSLGSKAASLAENVDLSQGVLSPLNTLSEKVTLSASDFVSVFPWDKGDSTEWLGWNKVVNVEESPIHDDEFRRIYYTGDGVPKVRGIEEGLDVVYPLTIPSPTMKPDAELFDEFTIHTGEPESVKLVLRDLSDDSEIASAWIPAQEITDADGNFTLKHKFDIDPLTLPDNVMTEIFVKVTRNDTGEVLSVWATNHKLQDGEFGEVVFNPNGNKLKLMCKTKWDRWDDDGTYKLQVLASVNIIGDYKANPSTTYMRYCLSYVTAWGEESGRGPIGEIVIRKPGQSVKLKNLTSGIDERGITALRLYRSYSAGGVSDFKMVAELPLAVSTWTSEESVKSGDVRSYSGENYFCITDNSDAEFDASHWINLENWEFLDTTADAELGVTLLTAPGPPDNLQGLVSLPGGFFAGFAGKEVWFSEPGLPYSWPSKYMMSCKYDVVGLGVSGRDIVVLTTGQPELIAGYDPASMQKSTLSDNQSCLNVQGIASYKRGVVYPSPDGLMLVRGAFTTNLTANYYTVEQWRDLKPENLITEVADGKIYLFFPSKTLIFNIAEGLQGLRRSSVLAQGVFYSTESDELLIIESDKLKVWSGSDTPLELHWRSGVFRQEQRMKYNYARVYADSYPVTLIISGKINDKSFEKTRTVLDDRSFRLPDLPPVREWIFGVKATTTVNKLVISKDLKGVKQ